MRYDLLLLDEPCEATQGPGLFVCCHFLLGDRCEAARGPGLFVSYDSLLFDELCEASHEPGLFVRYNLLLLDELCEAAQEPGLFVRYTSCSTISARLPWGQACSCAATCSCAMSSARLRRGQACSCAATSCSAIPARMPRGQACAVLPRRRRFHMRRLEQLHRWKGAAVTASSIDCTGGACDGAQCCHSLAECDGWNRRAVLLHACQARRWLQLPRWKGAGKHG